MGNTPLILRSTLSGGAKTTLSHSGLANPIGLAVDHKQQRLYWVDSIRGTVENMNYDGSDRQRVYLIAGGLLTSICVYKVCLISYIS